MKGHPVFNTVNLRPYAQDTISGRKPLPSPALVIKGDKPEWEVEYINGSRIFREKLLFLVKWKGYPQEESTWEPENGLEHAKKAVQEFNAKHSSAPRKISALTFSRLNFRPYSNFIVPSSSSKSFDWNLGKHIEGNVP